MKEYNTGAEILPGWKVVRLIGGGGFGNVYEAEKKDGNGNNYRSAIKFITIPQSVNEFEAYIDDGYDEKSITSIFRSQVDAIANEFKFMSQFKGVTNIVSCEDHAIVEHEDGHGWDVFIRMELLTSLTEQLKKNNLSEKEVVQLGVDICTALELCAKKNVIHRDIKPQNIFINEFGNYKLGDFGIAKTMDHATHATRIGTTNYMAPEVYLDKPYDARIDQYSLGLMMYWLLNERRLPFLPLPPAVETVSQRNEAMERRLKGEEIPRPLHGSDELVAVVLKACAYEPSDRYDNPTQMKYALFAAMAAAKDDAVTFGLTNKHPISEPEEKTEALIPEVTDEDDGKTEYMLPEDDDSDKTEALLTTLPEEEKTMGMDTVPDDFIKLPNESVEEETVMLPELEEKPEEAPIVPAADALPLKKESLPETEGKKKKGKWIIGVIIGAAAIIVMIFLLKSYGVSSISIESRPNKTSYSVGDILDTTGLSLNVTKIDGSSEIVTSGFSCLPTTLNSAGTQRITVMYKGNRTFFFVNVSHIVMSISVKSKPNQINYFTGDSLNTTGLVLNVTKDDGKIETVTSGFTCSPTILNSAGTQTITVTYKGTTSLFTVNVSDISVRSISVRSQPQKTQYFVGDSLNTTGLVLDVTKDDGKSETVASGFTCSPTILNSAGTQTITVTYVGKTTTYTVNVSDISVTSVSVKSMPNKTNYYAGESLDTSGLALKVTYNDGSSKTVTDGFFCSPSSGLCEGNQNITVNCDGYSTSFNVLVEKNQVYYQIVSDGLSVAGLFDDDDYDDSVTIPSSYDGMPVVAIGSSAFNECTGLRSITIPNSVTYIGPYAFAFCSSLTSITIPDSVTKISEYAFFCCSGLVSVTIPDSVTTIEECAFYGCQNLTAVTIPNRMEYIAYEAFAFCSNLTSVTIPKSVTVIADYAFAHCSVLTSITFNGTYVQWENITKGNTWKNAIGDFLIYCTDCTIQG